MIFMITIAITVRTMETAAKWIALCSAKSTALCISIITGTFFKSSVAKLIIQFTLLLITQNIIGFIYFLKVLCCRSISLLPVRMIFLGQFSVCFLNRCCILTQSFLTSYFCNPHYANNGKPKDLTSRCCNLTSIILQWRCCASVPLLALLLSSEQIMSGYHV